MQDKILIIGGYGQVGKYVTLELSKVLPNKVIVAGRNLEKAKSLVTKTNGKINALYLDIYDRNSYYNALKNISVVVMCLSPKNLDFAKYCATNGIHYIDTSPIITLCLQEK
ncbi:MAG: saccharopine dehydrogenase NADP-binding domain-containing protein [Defluviitaleaceae bacterium]|nr:saccharopine dehydrogenase NADP-binding domain-containing protein [Defluviitaleaceae bacterium]